MEQTTVTYPETAKLNLQFDLERLQADCKSLENIPYQFYQAMPLRSPAHLVDPSIPFPPPAEDYADGSWCNWLNTPELEYTPYIKEVIEQFQEHTTVNLVRLMRLEPHGVINEHTDPTLALEEHKSMVRLTIPIISHPETEFYLNNKIVPMRPGECWYMRLSDPHKVLNNSSKERINLSIDVIPNEWVKNLIMS
jgi:hypothetical protein